MIKYQFFSLFYIFYIVKKQASKRELPTKWKIYIVFYILLLKQDITKKKRVNTDPNVSGNYLW